MSKTTNSTETIKTNAKTKKVGRPMKYDRKVVVNALKKQQGKVGGLTIAWEKLKGMKSGKYADIAYITLALIAKTEGITFGRGRPKVKKAA